MRAAEHADAVGGDGAGGALEAGASAGGDHAAAVGQLTGEGDELVGDVGEDAVELLADDEDGGTHAWSPC